MHPETSTTPRSSRIRSPAITLRLVSALVFAGCSSEEVTDGRLSSLRAALDGRLDVPTQAALRTLSTILSYNDFYYLGTLDLRGSTAERFLADPVGRRAVLALVPAWRAAQASTSRQPTQFLWSLVGGTAWAQPTPTYDPTSMASLYAQAQGLVANAHANGTTQTPGASTAFANVIAYNVALGGPAPLPPGGPPLGSNYVCVVEYSVWAPPPNCRYTPPCSRAELVYPGGTWRCLDPVPPGGREEDAGAAADPDVPGGTVENACFVGPVVEANPGPWMEACTQLDRMRPNHMLCLNANPSLRLGAPRLPDGRDPRAVCVRFHNQDGAGTRLGVVRGCDESDGIGTTCWCCP